MHTPALFAQIFSQGRDEEDNSDLIQPIEQVTQASWLADSCRDGPTWAWESVHVAKCKRRVLTLKSEINIHCFTDDDHVHVSWNTETGPFFLRNLLRSQNRNSQDGSGDSGRMNMDGHDQTAPAASFISDLVP